MEQNLAISFEHIKENCNTIAEVKQLYSKSKISPENALNCLYDRLQNRNHTK